VDPNSCAQQNSPSPCCKEMSRDQCTHAVISVSMPVSISSHWFCTFCQASSRCSEALSSSSTSRSISSALCVCGWWVGWLVREVGFASSEGRLTGSAAQERAAAAAANHPHCRPPSAPSDHPQQPERGKTHFFRSASTSCRTLASWFWLCSASARSFSTSARRVLISASSCTYSGECSLRCASSSIWCGLEGCGRGGSRGGLEEHSMHHETSEQWACTGRDDDDDDDDDD